MLTNLFLNWGCEKMIPKEYQGFLNCPHCFKSYHIDMRETYDKCFVCGLRCEKEDTKSMWKTK